ncbi:MAG: DUF268 domain-containing protein [Sideroxydans sp.]|nr:DUF268 domain-containing protein [Sideroxydans sp.]
MKKIIKKIAKPIAKPILSWLRVVGINLFSISNVRFIPKYFSQFREFKKLGGKITYASPKLTEWAEQAGSASGHYFHQDLLVASFIFERQPRRHIDIGSRIDGFVAHVATFRPIEIIDIRSLSSTGHDNISFLQMDLMNVANDQAELADSISCLHAIEHFGLGRYGDPLNPNGHVIGFNNILKMLKPNGLLYISFPIAYRNEVHFNEQRVFHPQDILSWTNSSSHIELERFDYVDDSGNLIKNANAHTISADLVYGCGIYTFRKLAISNG